MDVGWGKAFARHRIACAVLLIMGALVNTKLGEGRDSASEALQQSYSSSLTRMTQNPNTLVRTHHTATA